MRQLTHRATVLLALSLLASAPMSARSRAQGNPEHDRHGGRDCRSRSISRCRLCRMAVCSIRRFSANASE